MFDYFLEYFTRKKLELTYCFSYVYMYKPGLTQGKIKTILTDKNEITIQKKTKNIIDLQKTNIRIALSKELQVPTLDMYKENSILKKRRRFTFKRPDYNFKIDMTRDSYNTYSIYQMEIEFICKPKAEEIYGVLNWVKRKVRQATVAGFVIKQYAIYN